MQFLDAFEDDQRSLFESAASRLELVRGELLLKKGDPGGDVFVLIDGVLEVLDRNNPELIVARLQPGEVVGEMAFIDDSPRSVDVRAEEGATVLRWARDDLRALLLRREDIAARFYRVVCQIASNRTRQVTEGVTSRAYNRGQSVSQEGLQRVREESRELSERAKSRFLEVDTALRRNPNDDEAVTQVLESLDGLQRRVHKLFFEHPEPEACEAAAEILCRELHPYLVRSGLAERCIRKPQGVTGTAEILAHVLVNTARGDGRLGELLDRWLLDRGTLQAVRSFLEPMVDLVRRHIPEHRNRRVLLVNAGTGSLVAALTEALSAAPTVLTVVDQSRDALAFLGNSGITNPRSNIEIETVQENLAQFAMGRVRSRLPPQDAVVVHGLVEYMPDRIAVSLVAACRGLLHEDGALVCSALTPSDDAALLDRLLDWPTIRRRRESLSRVFQSGGMRIVEQAEVPVPGLLVSATPTTTAH